MAYWIFIIFISECIYSALCKNKSKNSAFFYGNYVVLSTYVHKAGSWEYRNLLHVRSSRVKITKKSKMS